MGDSAADEGRKEFLELRSHIDEMEKEAAKHFDQAMLTLSAGSLGLSIAFIEKIAPRPLPWTYPILLLSWLGFGFSIHSILKSFLVGQEMARDCRGQLDQEYNPESKAQISRRRAKYERKYGQDDPFGEAVDVMNWRSIHLFEFGAAMLISFSFLNVVFKEAPLAERPESRPTQTKPEEKQARIPSRPPPPPSRPAPSPSSSPAKPGDKK